VQFNDSLWPLLITMGPQSWTERNVAEMAEGFDRYFSRGERYALISASPRDSVMAAKERKLVTDWSNTPRVRDRSRELCVGSATIARSALARGALTAIMWIWKPAAPHLAVANTDEAVDYALAQLAAAGIALELSPTVMRREAKKFIDVA
jgi:hypothetical protein